jgi:hypothetical protein
LKVVIVNVIETLVPLVFCAASDKGGVNDMLVSFDFETTVPDAEPHL